MKRLSITLSLAVALSLCVCSTAIAASPADAALSQAESISRTVSSGPSAPAPQGGGDRRRRGHPDLGARRGRRALRRCGGLLQRHLRHLHQVPHRDVLHRHRPAQRLRPRLPRPGLRERPLVLLRPRQPRALQAGGDRQARARGDRRRRQRRAVVGPRARRHQVRRGLPERVRLPHADDLLLR